MHSPKPYQPIQDNKYPGKTTISITAAAFDKVVKKHGTMEIAYRNCHFNELLLEIPDDIAFEEIAIHFYGCSIKRFELGQVNTKDVSLNFGNCLISGRVESPSLQNITFYNCIAENLFLLKLSRVNIQYAENNIFIHDWHLLSSIVKLDCKDIIARKQYYHLEEINQVNYQVTEETNTGHGLYLNEFHQIGDSRRLGYRLSKEQKQTINISLFIRCSADVPTREIKIDTPRLRALTLTGELEGKIKIEHARIDSIYFHSFSAGEQARFFDVRAIGNKEEGRVEIHQSDLDNFWFDNFDFVSYRTLSFYRSKFAKTIYSSCRFPESYKTFSNFKSLANIHYADQKPGEAEKDLYELLLQLKKALESSGNYYEAQKIHAISHQALQGVPGLPRQEKFILWVNYLSNLHGHSINRPLVGLLIFSVSQYILYLLSLDRIFNTQPIDWNLFGYYFSFLDLTHRSDFLTKDFNGWSLFLDWIAKLSTGFFIFQFISAFRKYGKK